MLSSPDFRKKKRQKKGPQTYDASLGFLCHYLKCHNNNLLARMIHIKNFSLLLANFIMFSYNTHTEGFDFFFTIYWWWFFFLNEELWAKYAIYLLFFNFVDMKEMGRWSIRHISHYKFDNDLDLCLLIIICLVVPCWSFR